MKLVEYYLQAEKLLKVQNYSLRTRKAYLRYIEKFLDFKRKKEMDPVESIRDYLLTLTPSSVKIAYSSIRFLYKQVIGKDCPFKLSKFRPRKRLPGTLTRDEIWRILEQVKNRKHFLMLALLYGSGLRISEVINLKVKDLDFQNLILFVECGKGAKDRQTILPELLKDELQAMCEEKKPTEYLFTTRNNTKYSIRTLQTIFEKAIIKSRINRHGSCHTLRHSFATCLLEDGVDLLTIKKLMGHKSIKTTSQYIHIASIRERRVKSPL